MSHWFYLLLVGGSGANGIGNAYNVSGIGIDKAQRIVYRAETSYLNSTADYNAARNATISAAKDIFGTNSFEVISVTNAWYAVGVGNAYPPPAISGPTSICPGSSGTFTATGFPGTIKWTCSGGLNLSVNGNTATVTNNFTVNKSASVNILEGGQIENEIDVSESPSKIPPVLPPLSYNPTNTIRAEILGTSIAVEREFTTNTVPINSLDLPLALDSINPFTINAGSETDALPLQSISSTMNREAIYSVKIVDIHGALVYTGEKRGNKFDLPVSSLHNGIYNVIISDETRTLQEKLIVKH